jgi:sugar/nucleoside kinase (ribokinase family)
MSRTIDIYAVGSAIVDTEVRVTPEFLTENGIDKGVMTLVDEARQHTLMEAIVKHHSHIDRACGGSGCNSAVAAAEFGATVAFSGRVGDDADGELFASDLKAAGIQFHDVRAPGAITGKCLVMVTPDADRTMNTFLGASQVHTLKEVDFDAFADSKWLYLEGYLLTDQPRTDMVIDVVKFARDNGVKIALSLSDPFVVAVFEASIRQVLEGGIDLLFCNADEAKAFTHCDDLAQAAQLMLEHSRVVAITDGANGALVADASGLTPVAGFAANAVDTNGAGDMFAGAFLAAYVAGADAAAAASFGNRCAAKVVGQYGPRLSKAALQTLAAYQPS